MGEQAPQPPTNFDEEAAARSRRFIDEVKSLGQPYHKSETLGDLVIDGALHPYVFLDKYNGTKLWRRVKGILMIIYKDYKTAKGLRPNEKWTNPLARPTFDIEEYSKLSEETHTLIEEYIEYLMQSEAETKPLDLEVHGLSARPINAEIPAASITPRHVADEPVSIDN